MLICSAVELYSLLKRRLASTRNPKVHQLVLVVVDALLKNRGEERGGESTIDSLVTSQLLVSPVPPHPYTMSIALPSLRAGSTGTTLYELAGCAADDVRSKAAEILQNLAAALPPSTPAGGLITGLVAALKAGGVPFPPVVQAEVDAMRPKAGAPTGRSHSLHGQQAGAVYPGGHSTPASPPGPRGATGHPVEEGGEAVAAVEAMTRAFEKLRDDLLQVRMAISKAARLLVSPPPTSLPRSDEFLDVVDFLEQCAVRLAELIEAGIGGAIQDELLFDECLSVNESVARILEVASPIAALGERGEYHPRPYPQLSDLMDYDRLRQAPPTGPAPSNPASSNAQTHAAAAHDDLLSLFSSPTPAPAPARASTAGIAGAPGIAPSPMAPGPSTVVGQGTPVAQYNPFDHPTAPMPSSSGFKAPSPAPAPAPQQIDFDSFSPASKPGPGAGAVPAGSSPAGAAPAPSTSPASADATTAGRASGTGPQKNILDELDAILNA
jgi:hypothetical protein